MVYPHIWAEINIPGNSKWHGSHTKDFRKLYSTPLLILKMALVSILLTVAHMAREPSPAALMFQMTLPKGAWAYQSCRPSTAK